MSDHIHWKWGFPVNTSTVKSFASAFLVNKESASNNRIAMNTRRTKVKHMKTCQYSDHETIDWNTCNAHKWFNYIIKQLWTFYSVNMVWYLMNLKVLTSAAPRSILSNSVNIRPYLLSKKSIIVYHSWTPGNKRWDQVPRRSLLLFGYLHWQGTPTTQQACMYKSWTSLYMCSDGVQELLQSQYGVTVPIDQDEDLYSVRHLID